MPMDRNKLPATLPEAASSMVLQPFGKRLSAGEFAFASLRKAILDLQLPPGTALSRSALAAQLGLSQTPIREALMRLQKEDLVEIVPSASTRVATIDPDSARQVQFLRQALELEVVRRLAEKPPPDLRDVLHACLEMQRALMAREDHAGFSEADDAFHAALYSAAGVDGLWDLVRSRSGHLGRLRRLHLPAPGKAEAILEEHAELTAAVLGGEAEAAQHVLRRHFSGTFARISEIRAAYPSYFSGGRSGV